MNRNGTTTLGAIALVVITGACAGRPEPEPEPESPPALARECEVVSLTDGGADAVNVALLDEVSPAHAPRPRNDAERLLFRHLYETLIRVDCRGRVYPGLAASWSTADGGHGWRFVLRADARFWDGGPVTANDVVWSWQSDEQRLDAQAFDSVSVEDRRTLSVHFERAYPEVPQLFADLRYAVMLSQPGPRWPLGTGPYRIERPIASDEPAHPLMSATPVSDESRPRIDFRLASGADVRDLLDDGIDVLITGDPEVLEYVAMRAEFVSVPLTWDRTYVVLAPSRVRSLQRGELSGEALQLPPEILDAFARDAVRGEARGHRSPAWWEELAACEPVLERLRALPPAIPVAPYRLGGPRRVAYARGDEVARSLAERIVALATRPTSAEQAAALGTVIPGLLGTDEPTRVAALGAYEFELALARGSEFLLVLALPTSALDDCYQLLNLAKRVPWLAVGRLALSATIVPLVDTRRHLIARKGAAAISLDWDGTLVISGADAEEGGAP
ncbi:MAG: hypothetical protein AMS25_08450 [Gemmatimonas sp. SM23_52]|nr:MAG: hypothetical protein AMS25_08450 [Gemmatimonas sp. SM23_52]